MQNNTKRDIILDAMQKLMNETNAQSISISDIAKKAGIGKGSIYYYFKSKEDILEAVIERAYSTAADQSRELLQRSELPAMTKLELLFRVCKDSSVELLKHDVSTFFKLQQSAYLHQQFNRSMIKRLRPVLADIIRQGNEEGSMNCGTPEETADIVLIILTVKIDNHLTQDDSSQITRTLEVFADMLETCFRLEKGSLAYLRADKSV